MEDQKENEIAEEDRPAEEGIEEQKPDKAEEEPINE